MGLLLLRTRVALGINRRNIPHLLSFGGSVHDAMVAAPALFPTPTPTLAVFAAQLQDLRNAQQATTTRARGTGAVRNAKAAVVVGSLECLQTYVQTLCDASPEQAHVIIEAAAMKPVLPTAHNKPELAAAEGPTSGSALLTANRSMLTGKTTKRSILNWQYSLDGGKTWASAPSTPLATTEVVGLPALTTVQFRVSATVAKVAGAWSQAVSLLVK
jgi:hypothetical protein